MKAKQVLAKVFASAMVFSTLFGTSVMAEEIDGGAIYIDQEIIDVTLPTTASQKFYIDPQGLIAVGKNTASGATADAGTVVGAFDMYAVNRSSVPLALSVSYQLKDTATSGGVTVVSTVSNPADDVQSLTSKAIAVSVSAIQSDEDADSGASAYGGKVYLASGSTTDIKDGGSGTPLSSQANVVYATDSTGSAATANYIMTAETYKVKLKDGKDANDAYDSSAYEYVVDTSAKKASCVKLTIGGYCSTKADWSDYADGTETLSLDIVFKFMKVTTTAGDYSDAAVSSSEVQVGPKVTLTANGVITITGLTAEKNITAASDVVVVGGSGTSGYRYPIKSGNHTVDVSGWTAADGGTLIYTLSKAAWSVTDGDEVTVEVLLKDDTKITSSPVTLSFN